MNKIAMIVPYEEMIPLARSAFEEHTQMEERRGVASAGEYEFVALYRGTALRDPLDAVDGADVVIARGVAFHLIHGLIGGRAVELHLSVYDLMVIFEQLRQTHSNCKIGVLGAENMVKHSEEVGAILGLNVQSYVFDSVVSPQSVRRLIDDGCEVIVGSTLACRFAEAEGVHSALIRTGRQSILQAIAEAKQIAHVVREEQEKAIYIQTVLDYSSEGILSVDPHGMVKGLNRAAKTILGVADDVLGRPLQDLHFPSKLQSWMMDDRTYLNEVVDFRKSKLSLNKAPMINKGSNIGNIAAFQDVTRLQDLEGIIRNKLFISGHVAKYSFDSIMHQSAIVADKIQLAKQYAQSDLGVMIIGESGTGKEMFAQGIHEYSRRRERPFVAVNCAALPESLLESELFGYVGGAFTGAAKGGKAGLFESAHGGTIFLDEISEMPHKLQGRLLRVLQEGQIMRLGHDRVTTIDVRVIAATNMDLKKQILKGEFREDLFFRLNVLRLKVPPLRERKDDVPLLASHFLSSTAEKEGLGKVAIGEGVLDELRGRDWPGNVRELMNVCDRLMVVSGGREIRLEDLHMVLEDEHSDMDSSPASPEAPVPVRLQVEMLERERIRDAMRLSRGNRAQAAQLLGWSRTTLWRKLKLLDETEEFFPD